MSWSHVKLMFARTADHPSVCAAHDFNFVAPMTGDGHPDEVAWRDNTSRARAHRYCYCAREQGEVCALIHGRPRNRALFYEPGEDDDEPVFKRGTHTFKEDKYLTTTGHHGHALAFLVANASPLDP